MMANKGVESFAFCFYRVTVTQLYICEISICEKHICFPLIIQRDRSKTEVTHVWWLHQREQLVPIKTHVRVLVNLLVE